MSTFLLIEKFVGLKNVLILTFMRTEQGACRVEGLGGLRRIGSVRIVLKMSTFFFAVTLDLADLSTFCFFFFLNYCTGYT